MSGSRIVPHILGALLLAVVLYTGGFWLDQHLRTRRGPWEVAFGHTAEGSPMMEIQQKHLGVRDVRIIFLDEKTNAEPAHVRFDTPGSAAPWGRVKYEDLTYLPGVITLEVLGHEIEMLPRALYVNRHAVAWSSGTNITLRTSDRPVSLPDPKAAAREARQK
jgi:hypothetical protein